MNIIGRGMIASAFKLRNVEIPDATIFASGVANSSETNINEFKRELLALQTAIKGAKKLVYFSTCSVLDPELKDTAYVLHKLDMELLIERSCSNYLIFRLPQVVGFTRNKDTLINFLFERIAKNQPINIWKNATRNLLDVEDLVSLVLYVLQNDLYKNRILNVACKYSVRVTELVKIIEDITNKKAITTLLDKGGSYQIDSSELNQIYAELGINFDEFYVKNLIHKYYLTKGN